MRCEPWKPRAIGPEAAARGFTLAELLVVITLLAILAAIATPAFGYFISGQRLRSVESMLTETLWLARSEAVKRNEAVGFQAKAGKLDQGWTVSSVGGAQIKALDAQPRVALALKDSLGNVVSTASFRFNSQGRLDQGGGTVVQLDTGDGGPRSCLSVSAVGRTSVTRGDCP